MMIGMARRGVAGIDHFNEGMKTSVGCPRKTRTKHKSEANKYLFGNRE